MKITTTNTAVVPTWREYSVPPDGLEAFWKASGKVGVVAVTAPLTPGAARALDDYLRDREIFNDLRDHFPAPVARLIVADLRVVRQFVRDDPRMRRARAAKRAEKRPGVRSRPFFRFPVRYRPGR